MSSNKEKKKIKVIDEKNELSYEEFQKDILIEKITSKDQQIYDLLSKLKAQESKIDILNKEIEEKDLNIYNLEQNYKAQKEELKNLLGFSGNIEVLLKKKENTYEYEFEQAMKQTIKDNIKKDEKINKLKEEITQIERENEQLNIFIEIKKNDETMLEIMKSIQRSKTIKKADVKSKKEEEKLFNHLNKKKEYLRKSINELKNNIDNEKNIMNSLPSSFFPKSNKEMKTNLNEEIKNREMKQKIEKIKEREKKETELLLNKYFNIMEQNRKEIIKGNEFINNADNIYSEEIKKYEKELFNIYKLIQKIVTIYYKSFDKAYSLLLRKEDCDKLFEKEINNLNAYNYPILFKLKEEHKIDDNNFSSASNIKKRKDFSKESKILSKKINFIKINEKNEDNKKIELVNYLNVKEEKYNYLLEDILSEKSSLFSSIERKNEEQLNNLSKEDLLSYALSLNTFIKKYEKFINKYIDPKSQKIYKKFLKIPKDNITNIEKRIFDVNNKIKEIIQKQNQTNIVMEASSNIVHKIKNENLNLSRRIKKSSSKEKIIMIPKINQNSNSIINKTLYSNDFLKKPLSYRNSMKKTYIIKNDHNNLFTERGYSKEKNKIYKIKIK